MSVKTKTLRLFFALWPDAAVRVLLAQSIEALKQTAAAKWVKPENLHITLAFLGRVNEDQLPLVYRVADSIVAQSFELILNRMEFWPNKGIICLSPAHTPAALENLANSLTAELSRAGLVMKKRPYRAHLTIARKARPSCISPRNLDDPICWNVNSFTLVESQLSRTDSVYLVRKTWNLTRFHTVPNDLSVR